MRLKNKNTRCEYDLTEHLKTGAIIRNAPGAHSHMYDDGQYNCKAREPNIDFSVIIAPVFETRPHGYQLQKWIKRPVGQTPSWHAVSRRRRTSVHQKETPRIGWIVR